MQFTAQEISETNTDILYREALREYRAQNYASVLQYTNRGLELAPEYHDIRILQIRAEWALEEFSKADADLQYLLKEAPQYPEVRSLAVRRAGSFSSPSDALQFIDKISQIYSEDVELQVKKAGLLLQNEQRKQARELALEMISKNGILGGDRYALQQIINRTVSNEIGINYQYINFSEEYSRSAAWHSVSAEFQHNFKRTAVIGRVTYSGRSYDSGSLYELEAYPVFSDKIYAFANVGFSDGSIFPDLRSSASLFMNFASTFEAEFGGRILFYDENSYFTGIAGLTAYSGKFYLNLRSFLGPRRMEQLVQNYQFNLRYYLKNADNFLSLRLGSGISPDETTLYSRVQADPQLDAWYGNLGVNKTLGVHHVVHLGAGFLYEDISSGKQGTQFLGTAGYRYRF